MRSISVGARSVRFAALAILAAAVLALTPAAARAQAKFTGVGDLPGGPSWSQVRDATKVGGTIIAVGGGASHTQVLCADQTGLNPPGCVFFYGADTAAVWEWDGFSTPVATALPNLLVNNTGVSGVFASAITPDGAYIASRARSSASTQQRQAVRVTRALAPFPSANFNLATLFTPALNPNTAAVAISQDGSILYGFRLDGRSFRFDTAGPTSAAILPPSGANQIIPAGRGVSADGSVMVASTNSIGTGRAYRYVAGTGLTAIPLLAGGTWNAADAVTPDGNVVLAVGNSSAYPNGEAYLYNATTGAVTPLGSPNRPWTPNNFGGITADGSVVMISFGGPTRGFAYFHNSHGWFLLSAAMAAQGIDVNAQGWKELGVLGISADGTLAFGQGDHNGNTEGWVAEFPAGYLAGFDAPAVPVSDTSIVGAWYFSDTDSDTPGIVVFMADGTYYLVQPTVKASEINAAPGLERGVYTWNSSTGAFRVVTLNDTNGDAGLSDNDGMLGATLFRTGDTLSITAGGPPLATRINAPVGVPLKNTIVGGWVVGNPAAADSSFVAVFDGNGTYYFAQDGPVENGGFDGVEQGTYTWDPVEQVLRPTSIVVDTNGDWGLSNSIGLVRLQPFIDGLTAQAGDDTGLTTARRVIDPNSVIPAITSAGTANGTWGSPFTFTVTATNGAYEFTATGLPPGLSIDGSTGVISGTPTAAGSYTVQLTAANSLRSGSGTLQITVVDKIVRTGFYAPANAPAGTFNVIKGGSTVPFKFNVSVNDAPKTDTAGLVFTLAQISCAGGGGETPVPFVTAGGTALRFDTTEGQFINNWQSPRTSGVCYIVRMTTTGDGQSLSALFRTK